MLDLAKVSLVITFVSRLLSTIRAIKKNVFLALSQTPSIPRPWRKTVAHAPNIALMPPTEVLDIGTLPLVASRVDDSIKLDSRVKRKRPARLVIPEVAPGSVGLEEYFKGCEAVEEGRLEVEGHGYCVASKKGRRHVMEDGYSVITDICDDPKQAYFGVFDGHGGHGALDFVTEKLGKTIVSATAGLNMMDNSSFEEAIKIAYMSTDREFLSQGISSGACVATVLVTNGSLYTANAGDCRVVLSRNGVAMPLTSDHRVEQDDERDRIEKSGGYVDCINGVWRVQGSLAVSRAIGDLRLKEWVISEPDTNRIELSPDCQFLVMASDGLWDKVTNQEAVDVVLKSKNKIESCRKLVDMSSSRGNKDDITIMIVDLQKLI